MTGTELSVAVPQQWQQHGKQVDELLEQVEQEILKLKGQIYDLEQRKQALQQHLRLSVRPMTCAAHPTAKPESEFAWSPDRRFVKCLVE